LHLAPGAVLPRLDVANDRQLYLAMLGPAILVAGGLWTLHRPRMAAAVTLALTVLLGGATLARNGDYRSEVALWRATVARSPGRARVWNNLGYAYALAGDHEGARDAYRRALAIDPAHVKARWNLDALEANAECGMRSVECGTTRPKPSSGP
jgi:tetratricopeptide (TPR) repeat protein